MAIQLDRHQGPQSQTLATLQHWHRRQPLGHHSLPSAQQGADSGLAKSENAPEMLRFSLTLRRSADWDRRPSRSL